MDKTDLLRSLPSVDDVLRWDAIDLLKTRFAHQRLVTWIRQAVDAQRQMILSGAGSDPVRAITNDVLNQARADDGQSIQRVINATGIMLHTNLGRAPLAQRAIDRVAQATAFANVELDLHTGRRSKRGQRAMDLLAELTGAEAAIVVNNCAAATMLVLQAVAGGKEVIISRGQLVEIGGGFRLPGVFAAAGVVLREGGTTNRTYVRDYENAIGENTGALIRVHHSNFLISGFVTEPTIQELLTAYRPTGMPVIDDVGSGCIGNLTQFGLHEPDVIASVQAGADVTLFSGDKLFGGPQAGIVVGKKIWIDKLRRHPLARAMRVDKMTLAALEATTEIHLAGNAEQEIPLMQMLCKTPEELQTTCQQVADAIRPNADAVAARVQVSESESQVGGGSVPGVGIPSFAVQIDQCNVDELSMRLRTGSQPVQGRVSSDSLWIDLRSVADEDVQTLTEQLANAIGGLR